MSPAWPFAKDAYKSLCLRAIHCWHIYLSLLGWYVYFDQEQILSLWHSQWLAIPFERNVPARRKLRISKLERALQGGDKTQKRYLYTKKILHHEMLKCHQPERVNLLSHVDHQGGVHPPYAAPFQLVFYWYFPNKMKERWEILQRLKNNFRFLKDKEGMICWFLHQHEHSILSQQKCMRNRKTLSPCTAAKEIIESLIM